MTPNKTRRWPEWVVKDVECGNRCQAEGIAKNSREETEENQEHLKAVNRWRSRPDTFRIQVYTVLLHQLSDLWETEWRKLHSEELELYC
jgi:hypothetical protein